jgi:AcrR family transcriptional regulator
MSHTKHKSVTVRRLHDRRVLRTRQDLDRAFLNLLQHRSYDAIRVSDITRNANVGRATFYAHYQSKDDLLRAQLSSLLESRILTKAEGSFLLDATALFRHLLTAHRLYRALMLGRSGPAVSKIAVDILEERVTAGLAHRIPHKTRTAGVPIPIVARLASASLMALIAWWVEHDMKTTPEELQAAYQRLVGGWIREI